MSLTPKSLSFVNVSVPNPVFPSSLFTEVEKMQYFVILVARETLVNLCMAARFALNIVGITCNQTMTLKNTKTDYEQDYKL